MIPSEHWDILFKNQQNPCFIADSETHLVLYVNDKMSLLLGKRDDVFGLRFYELLKNEVNGHWDIPTFDWEKDPVHRNRIYDNRLQQNFDCTVTLVEHQGKNYIFSEVVPLDRGSESEFDFDLVMSKCISFLQGDETEKIQGLLTLLNEFYNADCAYLYLIDHKQKNIFLENCVISKRISQNVKNLEQNLETLVDFDEIMKWLGKRNDFGILEANLVEEYDGTASADSLILEKFGLKNLVLSCIFDNENRVSAAIGLGNCYNFQHDYRFLQTVNEFLRHNVNKSEEDHLLDHLTQKDILTGFYSRKAYSEKVEEIQKNPPGTLAVVFANVNGLKQVNVEYGYAKGDIYIREAAYLIKNQFDVPFYRISGDEFIAFFYDVDKESFENSLYTLRADMSKQGITFFSLGHAWAEGRMNPLDMVNEAETIMYINKQEYYHSGKRNFDDISDSTLSDLLSYLQNDEFMIYLQPQVRLRDGTLHGAEALIRRFDKTNQKMVFPDEFISLYEKKSVIRHVDIFVVEQVCQLLQSWHKSGRAMLPISVNLSRVTLQEYGIVETIAKICDKYQIPREFLVIEVTERVGLIENNVASSLIRDFKSKGFKISLDDFGCAYSNIVTLAQIDVDEVKLDKSLVDYVTKNRKNSILVENVLRMCQDLDNISTLAEGIEDKEQLEHLDSLQCHLGQGYYFSRPMPTDDFFEKYLA